MLNGPEGYRHEEDRDRREGDRERRERPVDEPDDVDPNNPVDVSADIWRELYAENPDLLDNDQEP